MRLLAAALVTAGLAICPISAHAWGDEGHQIIALVAEAFLKPEVRRQVRAMLAADPDDLTPHDVASAATWADRYRQSDVAGARSRTRQWHFVNIEIQNPSLDEACFGRAKLPSGVPASAGPAQACIVDKIAQFAAELASSRTSSEERTVALKFLLHLVGDVHQPLHAADDNDRGGNDDQVSAPGFRAGNLHHFWDTEFVKFLGTDPRQVAAALLRRISPAQAREWSRGTPDEWALQSFAVARDHAYGRLPLPSRRGSYRLDQSYIELAVRDVQLQLARAGVRLAAVLNRALSRTRPALRDRFHSGWNRSRFLPHAATRADRASRDSSLREAALKHTLHIPLQPAGPRVEPIAFPKQ